ncbi:MAG: glutamine synthetase [Acidobacteria bacterium]|nr:MAG: glutamine synthetase [Acidobacteriota bacterium]
MKEKNVSGMLSRADLEKSIRQGDIDTVLMVVPDWYGRFIGKRISGHFFVDHVANEGMHACDYLLACDMEMTPIPGYEFTSWDTGYGDFHCVPDFSTLRRAAWLPQTALIIADAFREKDNTALEVSPRRILQRQTEEAAKEGYAVMGGSEIELYAFDETFESARAKNYHNLKTLGNYIEDYHILQGTKEEPLIGAIRKALDASGVPVEFTKGEWGPGQQEINLEFCDALTQADRNLIYKHAAKEIAHLQGKAVTFMAKWDETFAGSSMHMHVSLWNGDSNLFSGDRPFGPVEVSDVFRWFLGGWMKHAREFAVCYAPNIASYKRYQSASFAPTGIAWSYDNRTAGFRVVGHGSSLRIESRIPGADANPYIAYAATIAAGLDGIRNRIEPPAMFAGNMYEARDLPRVPTTLREAILEFENSAFARKAFGEAMVNHYLHFLRTEQKKFDEVVTCWERARYFERI